MNAEVSVENKMCVLYTNDVVNQQMSCKGCWVLSIGMEKTLELGLVVRKER